MYKLGDIIETKKPHACKATTWEVVRVGADIKLKCEGCGRIILVASYELDKKVKKVIKG